MNPKTNRPFTSCSEPLFQSEALKLHDLFILMQIKLIFIRKVWPHFESESFWKSEVAYSCTWRRKNILYLYIG